MWSLSISSPPQRKGRPLITVQWLARLYRMPVKDIVTLLDILGKLSAQRLPGPVTSYQKFRTSNHKIFLLSNIPKKIVLGFLKIGKKKLFVHDKKGACFECMPLCVLDFYIHESHQRQGCGKKLFDFMLQVII
ncbi:unnamed protein product [Trichobilharzia regenti]|nr:unnamed protein product [Trichobilharzia regenti]